jgi:choline-sulfatase
MPLLTGKTDQHKAYIFSEFLADNKAMVRNKEWKYIFTTGQRDLQQGYATGNPPPGITHRLYDEVNDPNETRNLANHPEYLDVVEKMQQEMIAWFKATHPNANEVADSLSVEEKLVQFCEPPEGNAELEAQ